MIGAIDIGGTKIAVGVVDDTGKVIASSSFPTAPLKGWQAALSTARQELQWHLRSTGVTLQGIGIGCTGPVYPQHGTVGKVALLPGWEGCPLAVEFATAFGVDVALENDADAAAMAECMWGSGRGVERFLYVTVSTGIGAGFLLNGKVYRGPNGSHPEMGHHVIDSSGPECACGSSGCFESLASGTALAQWFQQSDPRRRQVTARQIFELAAQQDACAVAAVARFSRYLAIGLGNLVTILTPDVIAIGGGVAAQANLFLPSVSEYIARCYREVPARATKLCAAELRGDVGLAGAAATWLIARKRLTSDSR